MILTYPNPKKHNDLIYYRILRACSQMKEKLFNDINLKHRYIWILNWWRRTLLPSRSSQAAPRLPKWQLKHVRVIGYVLTAITSTSPSEKNAIDVKYRPGNRMNHRQPTILTTTRNLICIRSKWWASLAEMAVMHPHQPTRNLFHWPLRNKNRREGVKTKRIGRLRNIRKICRVCLLSLRNTMQERLHLLVSAVLIRVYGAWWCRILSR